ncbi:CDP-diacylglycerol--serine O-phosphatidyltransferase [Marinibacterium profundimaris]|uniref:CDP-diacylglycerol--serine O-phosphatidyltransferase n=1 Tax=Marinibacterium profundimaris TaxID=1679460 RepID=A0A225NIT2_9RHOB|nr:CDP-diacylglycerol--serine O-phosphatidyltransferase [Marinibacterium profundimaris]OWU71000.1 CDP-diacylglycerol--serine O-phosphatidyltransferase [Marinibacterium profundimaris]
MSGPSGSSSPSELSINQLLPNMLTITAVCAGVSAIRFGVDGNYVLAVQLILAAAVLDGLDGRLARALDSQSVVGAELDSLADFVNFGVAPPLVLYYWGLREMPHVGWLAVLVFAICCLVRLARFNVANASETTPGANRFFTGVPAPAGALLVMLPLYVSFAVAEEPFLSGWVICAHMVIVGALMISRIPTWSFKAQKIPRERVRYFFVVFAVLGAGLLIFTWVSLALLCLAYVAVVIIALIHEKRRRKEEV